MPLVSGSARRFFEFRGRGRDLLSKRTLRSRFCICTENDHCDRWSSMCTQFPRFSHFFSFFFLDLRLVNLEPRYKFQRALRPKEEDRRGLDKLSRRGAAPNGFSSFGSVSWVQRMGSHCYYFVTVLVLVIRSICCIVWPICMLAHRSSSHHGQIAIFALVLRYKNNRVCFSVAI